MSFSRRQRGAALLRSGVLRGCPRVVIVGSVDGDCNVPKLHLNVVTDTSVSAVGFVERRVPV